MRTGGEFDLIAAIAERLAQAPSGGRAEVRVGIGDDAAVVEPAGATVTSVDAIVEGVHFRRGSATMRSVGHKALAAALSDLAAMGAAAGEGYVVLGVPEDAGEAECLELCDGLAALAAETGTAVIGGDVTAAPALFVSVTVVGHARSADAVVGRDGADVGDAVAVTGHLGGAAAGLVLLDRPDLGVDLDEAVGAELRSRQLEPRPRIAAGAALAAVGASAMIDLSDGLGGDAGQIAAASGVGVEIELERIPIQDGVEEVAGAAGLDPADLAVGGGEDYELLVTMPPDRTEAAVEACSRAGARLTVIGRTADDPGVLIRRPDGSSLPAGGFDHLRARRSAAERG